MKMEKLEKREKLEKSEKREKPVQQAKKENKERLELKENLVKKVLKVPMGYQDPRVRRALKVQLENRGKKEKLELVNQVCDNDLDIRISYC